MRRAVVVLASSKPYNVIVELALYRTQTSVVFLALLILGLLTRDAPAPQAACHRYERDTVALRGHVTRRIYPGRPNYESIRRGNEPDTVFVLRLDSPLCITAAADAQAQRGVREVQLYFSQENAAAIQRLVGKSVTIRGTFEGWTWGWHHLPVLLHVCALRTSGADARAV